MTDLPIITQADIRERVGERSFRRGLRYFREGYILTPRRQGNTLKARCLGSRPQPYHVEATLGPEGIVSAHCSCPVGEGGYCKHTAALLLTWLHRPDDFTPIEELETALQQRSKEELIALIRRMLARDPDLEMLLELPIVGEGRPRPVDPEVIRRQAGHIFQGLGYDEWGATYGVAQQLDELVALGRTYAEHGDWRSAAVVYRTVAEETLDNYELLHDEGEISAVIEHCVEGLGECLAAAEDPAGREGILLALFNVYRWDVDFGGVGMDYPATDIILERATPEERRRLAKEVRQRLATGSEWARRTWGGFLLDLEADWLDDQAYLDICRQSERWNDLVDRLLALGRTDEAVGVARQVGDYDLLRLAEVFEAHGQIDLIAPLIGERAQTSQDDRLTAWLREQAQRRGDREEALRLTAQLFWKSLSLREYQTLRDIARSLDRWDDERRQILARLEAQNNYRLLTEIHLEEGAVDQALETVERVRQGWGWGDPSLRLRVAQAAEKPYPQEAIRIYVAEAQQLIKRRGRGNYATAATYLARVRDLYHSLGQEAEWEAFIAGLREQNRRLPALQDELNKAGL